MDGFVYMNGIYLIKNIIMKYKTSFYIKYYATRLRANLLYTLLGLIYSEKIQKGDKIKCYGIGYPQWKGEVFECTLDFKDGTIGIRNGVRVAEKDFRIIKITV